MSGLEIEGLYIKHYINSFVYFFTALRGMQMRSSNEKAVCPSVKCMDCDKTEERSVQTFIPHEISFSLVF